MHNHHLFDLTIPTHLPIYPFLGPDAPGGIKTFKAIFWAAEHALDTRWCAEVDTSGKQHDTACILFILYIPVYLAASNMATLPKKLCFI